MKRNLPKFISVLSGAAMFAVASVALAATVTVIGNTSSGENQPGWMFNRDTTTATPYEFNNTQASIGTGSLYVKPIGTSTSDKFIGENFINAPIADINSISYDFRIGAGGTDTKEEQFYMNVYANFGVSDDLKFYDCRYNVVPTVGSTAGWTTVTFDPTQAYPVTTRGGASASPFPCPAKPADMDGLSTGSNIRVFALNVGDTSASDAGLDGYLDRVVVDRDSNGATTYDFERDLPPPPPPAAPTTKDQCMKDGWKAYGFKNQGQCIKFIETGRDSRATTQVAAVAQALLHTSDRGGAVGKEVRDIAWEHAFSAERLNNAIHEVESRGSIKTALVGSDYKNLGQLRSEIVVVENTIDRLEKAKDKATDPGTIAELDTQIAALKATASSTLEFVEDSESKFSIFGWLVRLLNL